MMKKILKKFYLMVALVLAVGGIFLLMPSKVTGEETLELDTPVASAEETIASGITWAEKMATVATSYSIEGSGSYDSPYLIKTASDLAYMAYMVNEGAYVEQDGYVFERLTNYWSLGANIDLSGAIWTPIGISTGHDAFNGTFYGNGYTISNITITEESLVYETDSIGLFGKLHGGNIYDLKLGGYFYTDLSDSYNKGVLIGSSSDTTVYSIVSNIRDEMVRAGGVDIKTIGEVGYGNNIRLFKSASFDGKNADLSTQAKVDASVTVGSGTPKVYYLARYVIPTSGNGSNAKFYWVGESSHRQTGYVLNGNMILNIPVSYDSSNGFDLTGFSNRYFTHGQDNQKSICSDDFTAEGLKSRASASQYDFYARCPGYNITFDAFATLSFSGGLNLNANLQAGGEISFTIDYEYGTDSCTEAGCKLTTRHIHLRVPCETRFSEIDSSFWSDKKVFDRVGYTLNAFANKSGTSQYYTGERQDYNDFPIAGETYYFPLLANVNYANSGASYINFLISTEEGGIFDAYEDVKGAVQSVNIYSETDYEAGQTTSGYSVSAISQHVSCKFPYASLTHKSGNNYIEITLTPGYCLSTRQNINMSSDKGQAVSLKGYAAAGIYLNYGMHSGVGDNYTTNHVNNDDYATVAFGTAYNNSANSVLYKERDSSGSWTVVMLIKNQIANINLPGEINIVLEREFVKVDVTPIWGGDINSAPSASFSCDYQCDAAYTQSGDPELAYFYSSLSGKHNVSSWQQSRGSFNKNSNDDRYKYLTSDVYVYVRYNEPIEITFTPGGNYSISGVDTKVLDGFAAQNSHTSIRIYRDTNKNMVVYNSLTKEFYSQYINPVVVASDSTVNVKYMLEDEKTSVENTDLTTPTSNFYGILANINGTDTTNNAGTEVSATSAGKFIATNNSKYRIKTVKIYKNKNKTGASDTRLTEDELKCTLDLAQNGVTQPTEADLTCITDYSDGTNINYFIEIILEKVKYKVEIINVDYGNNTPENGKKLFLQEPGISINKGTLALEQWATWDSNFQVAWALSSDGYKVMAFDTSSSFTGGNLELKDGEIHTSKEYTVGTQNIEVDLKFKSKIITLKINTLSNGESANTGINQTLTLIYDGSKIAIKETSLNSITISSAYALTGWDLNGAKITSAYNDLLTNSTFIDSIVSAINTDNKTEFTNVKAVVEERNVQVVFYAGEAGDGCLYKSDQNTVISDNCATWKGSGYTYSKLTSGLNLDDFNNWYYNLGHTFKQWTKHPSGSVGTISNNKLTLTLSEFARCFGVNSEYQARTAFEVKEAGEDFFIGTKGVHLTAQWQKISYYVSVDGQTAQAKIQIGDTLTATYDGNKNAQISYKFGSNTINGKSYTGSVAEGFTITKTDGGDSQPYAFATNKIEVAMDLDFIKKFVASDYYFGSNSTTNPIKIDIQRDSAEYTLTIAEDDNDYYSVSGTKTFTEKVGSNFTNLKQALDDESLVLTRKYFTLTGFSYEGKSFTVNESGGVWTINDTFQATKDVTLTPIWKLNDDLSEMFDITFINGANSGIEYRLGTDHDFIKGCVKDSALSTSDLSQNLILKNGLKVTSFSYYLNGNSISTNNVNFSTQSFTTAGKNSIQLKVTVEDTLNTATTKVVENSIEVNVVQNELTFSVDGNYAFDAVYTGTSEILLADWDKTWTNQIYVDIKYDWKGEDVSRTWGESYGLKNYCTAYSVAGSDFNVGIKDLSVTIGQGTIYYQGQTDEEINTSDFGTFFSNANATIPSAVNIVKKNFEIAVDLKTTYDDTVSYYTFGAGSGTFTSGKFSYSYDSIIFNKTESGTYAYDALSVTGVVKFVNLKVTDSQNNTFVVTDANGDLQETNFTYSIAQNSKIEIGKFSAIYFKVVGTATYVYNGLAVDKAEVTYSASDSKYYIEFFNDKTSLVKVEANVYYKVGGLETAFADEERQTYLDGINDSFNFDGFNKNVGTYTFSIDNFNIDGQTDAIAVNIENGSGSVEVTPKVVEITSITKVFDGKTSFDSNIATHSVMMTELVGNDSIVIKGEFADKTVGSHSITIWIDSASNPFGNYTLAGCDDTDDRFTATGTITALTGQEVQANKSLEYTYGEIVSGAQSSELVAKFNVRFTVGGNSIDEYITKNKTSLTIKDADYSTGGYLKANTNPYTVVYKITCPEYGFTDKEVEVKLTINKLTITVEGSGIEKTYDGKAEIPGTVIGEFVNQESGHFTSEEILPRDVVSIASGIYSDANVGEGKTITVDFDGDDAGNYNILSSVSGTITAREFTIIMSVEEPNKQSHTFNFDYINTEASAELTAMGTPIKDGYAFAGWTLDEEGINPFKASNFKEIVNNKIIAGEYTLTIYPVWTESDFTLKVIIDGVTVKNGGTALSSGDELTISVTDILVLDIETSVGYAFVVTTDGDFSGNLNEVITSKAGTITISNVFADEEITIAKIEREYNFELGIKQGQEDAATIPSDVKYQTVKIGYALSLSQTLKSDEWVLVGWYCEINGTEKLFADASTNSVDVNIDLKDLLEQSEIAEDAGDDSTIYIYAVYDDTMVSCTALLTNGSPIGNTILSQDGISTVIIENGVSKNVALYKGKEVEIDILSNNLGYSLDSVVIKNKDGQEVALEEVNYSYDSENGIIKFVASAQTRQIAINLKTVEHDIIVRAGVNIDGAIQIPSGIGGKVYLATENGAKITDPNEYYTITKEGIDYVLKARTGETLYFVLEGNLGYGSNLSASGASVGSENKIYDGKTVQVWRVSNFTSSVNINATFAAKTHEVVVSLVKDIDSFSKEDGGVIAIEESDGVYASINNQYAGRAKVVYGSDLSIIAKSKLGYTLYNQSTNNKVVYFVKSETDANWTRFEITGSEDTWISTGFSQKANITLNSVTSNMTIYVLVVPNTYNVRFVNRAGKNEVELGEITVTYNTNLNLAQLDNVTRNAILNPDAPERYYSFDGYYTQELRHGNQYLDKDGVPKMAWKDSGYYFDGAQYMTQSNYNSTTNTFTLYTGWDFIKAKLTVDFVPDKKIVASKADHIRDIILNDDTDNVTDEEKVIVWTTQYDAWYGEVYFGSVLNINAPEIENYEFKHIILYYRVDAFNEFAKVKDYSSANVTLDSLQQGEYKLQFVYYPKFTMEVENLDSTEKTGGTSWLEQKGAKITNAFDSRLIITLKAEANEGYEFRGWKYKGSDTISFFGSEGEDGIFTYTFADFITNPLDLVAVFEGKAVVINIDSIDLARVHDIISITTNGKAVNNNSSSFNSRIGDEIVITIRKGQGYTFEMFGGNFGWTIDASGNYVFKYVVALDGVVATEESYEMDISFKVEPEKINLTIGKYLIDEGGSDIQNERNIIGSIAFIDAKGKKVIIEDSQTVIILYGQTVSFQFMEGQYYQVKALWLTAGNNESINLFNYVNGNTFDLTAGIIANYFDKSMSIRVDFERKTWYDSQSSILPGMGTKENPFIISSAQDMAFVCYYINNGKTLGAGKASQAYYKVVNSIDFSGRYWIPIGTKTNPFEGHFDLGSNLFTNVVYCYEYDNPTTSYSGLFWIVSTKAVIIQGAGSWIVWVAAISAVLLITAVILAIAIYRLKRKEKYNSYL